MKQDNELLKVDINIPDDPEKTKWEMEKSGEIEKGIISENSNNIVLPSTLGDLKYIFKDILDGDPEALKRMEFQALNFSDIKKALEWLASTNNLDIYKKEDLMMNGWRLNFRDKPPSPSEFLTPKYLGDQANALHPWIRETFENFFDPIAPYRSLILSSCIGTGKSQPLTDVVYTDKETTKTFENIQEGDYVMAPDGEKVKVAAVREWEPEDVYEITLDDGSSYRCGINHIHNVYYRRDKNFEPIWENVDTRFILSHPDYNFHFRVAD